MVTEPNGGSRLGEANDWLRLGCGFCFETAAFCRACGVNINDLAHARPPQQVQRRARRRVAGVLRPPTAIGIAASARRWRRGRRRAVVTRPSARHRHLVAFGVHALHVRHVVALLGRHVAAGRLRYLLRSELSARAVVRLKLLDGLPAAGKDHDARAGWRGSATGDQDGRRDRDCGTTKCLHAGVRTGNADSAIVYRRSRTGATTSSKSRAFTPRCRHSSYVTRRAWRRSAAKIRLSAPRHDRTRSH
jgi:hypothetical protein